MHASENLQEVPVGDLAYADYTDIIRESAFAGPYPIEAILDGLHEQFQDYINISDTNNYVDIFYNQLAISYEAAEANERELYVKEVKEAIDDKYVQFISTIKKLFDTRLTITISALEDEKIYDNDLEATIRQLYEFFILGARSNFKIVISRDLEKKTNYLDLPTLTERLHDYSPLISTLTPEEFLELRGNTNIKQLFENGVFNGNFLRKYSPKLYQNDGLCVEIVNHTTMLIDLNNSLDRGEN